MQEDSIKDGVNWGIYCGNDPVNFTDPSGLDRRLVGWFLFHGCLEVRKPDGRIKQLNFGGGVFGGKGGYSVDDPEWGGVPLSPWVHSTPEQDQALIDNWYQLDEDRKAGKISGWSPWNNCWVGSLSHTSDGIPKPPTPREDREHDKFWWARGGLGGM